MKSWLLGKAHDFIDVKIVDGSASKPALRQDTGYILGQETVEIWIST